MAKKLDSYKSYGQKLISLLVRLMFSGERVSLTELARMENCSKQTIIRLLNDIRMSYGMDIEETFQGNKKYYRIKRPVSGMPLTQISETEIRTLQMCRDFTEHLIGKPLYEEATRALMKSRALLPEKNNIFKCHFASFRPGTIDYSQKHAIIHTLIEAMEKQKVCKLTYQGLDSAKPKTFHVKPLKLFSHADTIYLHTQKAKEPGKPYRSPKFDPLLAVHRIQSAELTDIAFQQPENFDFDKVFNSHFGVMKDDAFTVEVEFTGWPARFVTERIWSANQKIKRKDDNTINLTFTASSETELLSWLLSFGDEARLIKPKWLVKEMKAKTLNLSKLYGAV
ncbi:MAG: WYL domain-containing protein [Smithellaceae bacterium]|jgi:predicted DNA-binding transcriptional regulator YafY|nr:WYL domain-containing protein [Chloroflexota bacterium]